MCNSVWLEDREMHRFLWRNSQDEEISEPVITSVNIGDRPAGCIAQLAMRETARLPMFTHLEEEHRVLKEDSYMDDIFMSHNDPPKKKKTGKVHKRCRGNTESWWVFPQAMGPVRSKWEAEDRKTWT